MRHGAAVSARLGRWSDIPEVEPTLSVTVARDRRGAWRWSARHTDGTLAAISGIRGWATREDAVVAAIRALGASRITKLV